VVNWTVAKRVVGVVIGLAVTAVSVPAQTPQRLVAPAQRINRIFEPWDRPGSPGCAVGVAQNGKVVYTRGYGMANLEYGVKIRPYTIFESGSVAKQFTAAAIVLLALDGKLLLDDPVRQYVPEVPDFGTPILIRHLLSHTSGLRSQWPLLGLAGRPTGLAVHTVPEILELVSFQKELNFKPGDEYLYNNMAFTLLSVIVQRVSGKSFDEFCQERLFKPLGMTRTRWRDDFTTIVEGRATAYRKLGDGSFRTNMPFTNVIGNGGLLTTVDDLLRWNENLDTGRVGGQAFTEQMQTRARLNDGFELGYAKGLTVGNYRGIREVGHGGSTAGYQTYLVRFPDERLSVAVLCNTTGTDPGAYAHQVADVFLRDKLKPLPTLTVLDVPTDVLVRVEGVYRDRETDALAHFVVDKEKKTVQAMGLSFVPTADGVLTSTDGARTVTFDGTNAGTAWPATTPVSVTDRTVATRPRVWYYEKPFVPTAAQLAEFAGVYVSDELGVTYTVSAVGGKLEARFRPAQHLSLTPVFADGFENSENTIRFTRDSAGKVDGFRVYAGRVRHLRFTKQR
jgi:CubicO group peptidase (beta-lactamase class C family)